MTIYRERLARGSEAFNVLFSKYRRLLYKPCSRVLHSHEEARMRAKLLSPSSASCQVSGTKVLSGVASKNSGERGREHSTAEKEPTGEIPGAHRSTEVGEIVERLPSPGPTRNKALVNKQSALALEKSLSGLAGTSDRCYFSAGLRGTPQRKSV